VHVPKAAGLSVGKSLYGHKTGDHRTIADYMLCFKKSDFDSFFKFAFVRNPWDRLLSAYLYLKNGGRNKDDYTWAKRHLAPFSDFGAFVHGWVNDENIRLGLHFRPQHEFVSANDLTLNVDFIGYFENIHQDYNHIRWRIGGGNKLVESNRTERDIRDYKRYYTNKMVDIVAKTYRKDIKLFGYNFEGISQGFMRRSDLAGSYHEGLRSGMEER
jgi:hypothetical protein